MERAQKVTAIINEYSELDLKIPETEGEDILLFEEKEVIDKLVDIIENVKLPSLEKRYNLEQEYLNHLKTDHAGECKTCIEIQEKSVELRGKMYNLYSKAYEELKNHLRKTGYSVK